MKTPLQFYFDFSSPYSYIASEWIEALAARHGRTVQWHAVLLGVTFAAAELKPPVAHPIKREYALRDFARSAHFEGLPYQQPHPFPVATHNAARVFWWLHDSRDAVDAVAWARLVLRAYFARGVPIHDAQALAALANEFGLADGQAEAVYSDARWKDKLRQVNEAAIASGVFGAPTFIVDGEHFWGNDRRAQLERWLSSGPF